MKYFDLTKGVIQNSAINMNDKTLKSADILLNQRLTAIGCQGGWLGMYWIDSLKNGNYSINILQ
jgi:hypothetical protein